MRGPLPDIDGYDVCRRLRSESDVPIIVVTARGDEADRVIGLELGADDYIVKPFGFRELVARIRAVTRSGAAAYRGRVAGFVLVILEIPLGTVFARNEQARLTSAVERDATVLAGVAEDRLERGVDTNLDAVVRRYDDRTGGRVVIVDGLGISIADSDPVAPGRRDFSTRSHGQPGGHGPPRRRL